MAEEEWDFVDGLKRTKTARVCMTCQHFAYATDQHCHTLLICGFPAASGASRPAPLTKK